MNWINDKACFYTIIALSTIYGSIIITCFAMFFNYNDKLSKDSVEITKIDHRTKELEKKNVYERHQIDELKDKVKNFEKLQKRVQELEGKLERRS